LQNREICFIFTNMIKEFCDERIQKQIS
jgi:hypothetical protein